MNPSINPKIYPERKPSKESEKCLFYQYEFHESSENGEVNSTSSMEIEFNQSMISSFTVSKVP